MAARLNFTDDVDTAWANTAIDTIEVAASPRDGNPVVLDLSGRCPRCRDAMHDTHWLIAFNGVSAMTRDDTLEAVNALQEAGLLDEPLLPAEFTVQCRCEEHHPDPLGRTGLRGCGALWRMRFEVRDEGAE